MTRIRLWLARLVAPRGAGLVLEHPPCKHMAGDKKPTNLWVNRRQAMLLQGYDPRDTADP